MVAVIPARRCLWAFDLVVDMKTLRDLEIGDRFYAAASKNKLPVMVVSGACVFNSGHGSSTRMCRIAYTETMVSKSCNLRVVKIKPNDKTARAKPIQPFQQ